MYYATDEEILDFMRLLRHDYIVATQINATLHAAANARVLNALRRFYIFDDEPQDRDNLLKFAEIFFYLELAGMSREIDTSMGVVEEVRMGNFIRRYERNTPMFFFAEGASEKFIQLLPHMTWQMQAYNLLQTYSHLEYHAGGSTDAYGYMTWMEGMDNVL